MAYTPFKKTFPNKLNNSKKDAQIEKNIDRREKSISKFADAKSRSIMITSAFNGAWDMVVALVHTQQITPEQRWEEHEKLYQEYFERLQGKQNDEVIVPIIGTVDSKTGKVEYDAEKIIQIDEL